MATATPVATPTAGSRRARDIWPSIRCASTASRKGEWEQRRRLTTSSRTEATWLCSGIGPTGKGFAARTTAGRRPRRTVASATPEVVVIGYEARQPRASDRVEARQFPDVARHSPGGGSEVWAFLLPDRARRIFFAPSKLGFENIRVTNDQRTEADGPAPQGSGRY